VVTVVALALLLAGTTMAWAEWKRRASAERSAAAAVARASTSAPSGPITLGNLPPPKTNVPAAAAAFAAALQAMRDADATSALAGFRKAAELDPFLAIAHLRSAMMGAYTYGELTFDDANTAESFHRAVALRAFLGPRDTELLDIFRPIFESAAQNWAALRERLTDALKRNPNDAELQYWLGWNHYMTNDYPAARTSLERALQLDPLFVGPMKELAIIAVQDGDLDEARRLYDRCLELVPSATMCLTMETYLDRHEGKCALLETHARRLANITPADFQGYRLQVLALSAQNGDPSKTRELIHTADGRAGETLPLEMLLEVLLGEFSHAEQTATEFESRWLAGRSKVWRDQWVVVVGELQREMGRLASAGSLAQHFLALRQTWTIYPDDEADPAPRLWNLAYRAGVLSRSAFVAQRDAWIRAKFDLPEVKSARGALWELGYAAIAETADEAREALDALPRFEPLPKGWSYEMEDAYVGRTYLLAGRPSEAVPWLQKATHNCNTLIMPIDHTRAHLWLGQALEQTGDPPGACEAYAVVEQRWGHATPPSVTAKLARERMRALGCR
jgi:serine/threonine-protein kinase